MQKATDAGAIMKVSEMLLKQMERLSDPTCDITKEVQRATALTQAGQMVINAGKAQLDAEKFKHSLKPSGKQKAIGNAK